MAINIIYDFRRVKVMSSCLRIVTEARHQTPQTQKVIVESQWDERESAHKNETAPPSCRVSLSEFGRHRCPNPETSMSLKTPIIGAGGHSKSPKGFLVLGETRPEEHHQPSLPSPS
jgi:hypothetical protein